MSLWRTDTPINARSNFDAKCQYGHFGSNKGGTGFMRSRIGKIFARWHLAIAITSLHFNICRIEYLARKNLVNYIRF